MLCNATRRRGDGQHVILHQRVRGSIRAVRGIRNTRVFLTETRVVADDVRSAPKCPPAGVWWASWRIRCCIVFGIHNHPLFSAFPSSSFSACLSSSFSCVLTIVSTSSSSFFFALAFSLACLFYKSPRSRSRPLSSK